MGRHGRVGVVVAVTALLAPLAATWGATSGAAPGPAPGAGRQAEFARAAAEFGVPAPVLLAVGYEESRWEQHGGLPSTSGAHGVMGLVEVPAGVASARGDGARPAGTQALSRAAALAGVSAAQAATDPAANIRAGAALLASAARSLGGGALPADLPGWYGAVAAYAGTPSAAAARAFADDVYATIAAGARRTADGEPVVLAAQPGVRPDRAGLAALHLATPRAAAQADPQAECPASLDCDFVPAAYAQTDPNNKQRYGNYDLADRPRDGIRIDRIVMHDTESSYASTLAAFANPAHQASAHYVVRSADGHVTQMVPTRDVAWQAGNWYLNVHSVGIEQEGFAVTGASWYTEQLYRSSARLVSYLADRFGVPIDRQHILGHDNVQGPAPGNVAGMHWDPGPFWDWAHFLDLLGHPLAATGAPGSSVVTVAPRFDTNVQQVTDCEQGTAVPAQPASFVWLRTAPAPDAPLVSDPALHPNGAAGTTCAADWVTRPAPGSSSRWPAGRATGPGSGGAGGSPGSSTTRRRGRPRCRRGR